MHFNKLLYAAVLCLAICNCNKPDSKVTGGNPPEPKSGNQIAATPATATPTQPTDTGITAAALTALLNQIKSRHDDAPKERPAKDGATALNMLDVFSDSKTLPADLIDRKFVAINECAGDTDFTEYYRTGVVSENGGSAFHFLGTFTTGAHDIRSGMSHADLLKALGTPVWESDSTVIYSCPDPVDIANGSPDAKYDCGWFYFDRGKLIGLSFYMRSDDC